MFSFVLKSYSNIDCSATSESSVSLPAQLQSVTDGSEKRDNRETFWAQNRRHSGVLLSRAFRSSQRRSQWLASESMSLGHFLPDLLQRSGEDGQTVWPVSWRRRDGVEWYQWHRRRENVTLLSASPSVQTRMTTHRRLVNGTLQRTFEVMQIALFSDRFLGWSPFAITRELLSWLDGKRTD